MWRWIGKSIWREGVEPEVLARYLNTSNPLMRSASSYPVKLNFASEHLAAISTSCLLHLICVFLLQRAVFLCFMRLPVGMCILYKSHWGSESFPSWATATLDLKWQYMKCPRSLPALCPTAGHPGTGHLTSCSNLGKDTT